MMDMMYMMFSYGSVVKHLELYVYVFLVDCQFWWCIRLKKLVLSIWVSYLSYTSDSIDG